MLTLFQIDIGPAVLNGGISTFLAFVMLVNSRSVVFLLFFKIFFLVVIFGLYHGLIFLPVILSYVGPPTSYSVTAKHRAKIEPITIATIDEDYAKANGKADNGMISTNGTTSQHHQ